MCTFDEKGAHSGVSYKQKSAVPLIFRGGAFLSVIERTVLRLRAAFFDLLVGVFGRLCVAG